MDESKQPAWTAERIQKLIEEKIEEGSQLEYKAAAALDRSDSKKDDITKDVSAFANSAGGTIIYGLKEFDNEERKHLPERIDPVDGRAFSREWLDQIVGQISPRVTNLQITPVRVGPEAWHTCYVVEIPQGHTAHQARNLKYYRRYNFESVPMADHEIRDVMNRRKHPNLEFRIRIIKTTYGTVKILCRIWNKGSIPAQHYKIRALVPTIVGEAKLFKEDLISQEEDGFKFWRVSLPSTVTFSPIFPFDDIITEYEIPWSFHNVPTPAADYLVCTLFADEMLPLKRKISAAAALNDWT